MRARGEQHFFYARPIALLQLGAKIPALLIAQLNSGTLSYQHPPMRKARIQRTGVGIHGNHLRAQKRLLMNI